MLGWLLFVHGLIIINFINSMILDNSPITPDLTGAGGINSRLESATKISDNNSKTKDSNRYDL